MNILLKYLLGVFIIFLVSCTKDVAPLSVPTKVPSERYKMITSHYWRLAEKWQDTTVYGKAHPELIPLPTSVNVYVFTDSCQYYTCSKFANDGWYYTVKKTGCGGCGSVPSCEFFQNRPWSISEDEQTFYGPYDIDKILLVNDSVFKSYQYYTYDFTKKMLEVYVHKAYVFK